MRLPPTVTVELDTPAAEYFKDRARQSVFDTYAGIPMMKFPEDLRTYEHILFSRRVEVVLELGVQHGASTLWFRDRLRTLATYGYIKHPRVIGVDIDLSLAEENLSQVDRRYSREVKLIAGDLLDAGIVELVHEQVPRGASCLVIDDSAHTRESSLGALNGFADLVQPGGFFVVEDGSVDVEEMRIHPDWPRGVSAGDRRMALDARGQRFRQAPRDGALRHLLQSTRLSGANGGMSAATSPTSHDAPRAKRAALLDRAPIAIEVRDLHKSFQIPHHRRDTLRERVTHPFQRSEYRTLHALRGVTFDVREGEFFGIVGRNGSGKSTLLKIMSSIYRADRGRVRIAGRLAPFIELGVGFNPELTSRENVTLNGVLMGLGRREAARRRDAVLEFAELEDFADLKLKNYSSGMMVRLAFGVMVEADADVMLIDEVLAVGDAAFAQKCMSFFRERRDSGRTIVLVTHDMATVQSFCDRAMLIHDSELQFIGDPDDAALRYYRLNFGADPDEIRTPGTLPDVNARVVDAWLENESGERVQNVEQNERLFFSCVIEARRDMDRPVFSFQFVDDQGAHIFGFSKSLELDEGSTDRLAAGQRALVSGEVENRLLPGRYHVSAWVIRNRTHGDIALNTLSLLEFSVYGTEPGAGSVSMRDDVQARLLEDGS